MELKDMLQVAIDVGVRFGVRIIGAIALWIVGRALIGFCVRFIGRWLTSRHVDATLGRYIASAASEIIEKREQVRSRDHVPYSFCQLNQQFTLRDGNHREHDGHVAYPSGTHRHSNQKTSGSQLPRCRLQ